MKSHLQNHTVIQNCGVSSKVKFVKLIINFLLLFLLTDDYYLDPNGGSSWDKFIARCDFEEKKQETCIYPRKSTFEKKEWVTSGSDKWTWFLRDLAVNEEVKIIVKLHGIIKLQTNCDLEY